MARALPLLLAAPILLAAGAGPAITPSPIDLELRRAEAEAAAAERKERRFDSIAAKARDEAARLAAQQAAAAESIAAAEARISAAEMESRIIAARIRALRFRLAREQQPASSLLAGLVLMGRRPPLVAILGGEDVESLVRVRLLLDSTLPIIRGRTAHLSRQLAEGARLEQASAQSRLALVSRRRELDQKRLLFADLETKALRQAEASGGAALSSGDVALAAREEAQRLSREAAGQRSASAIAAELAALGPPPAVRAGPAKAAAPFDYRLPASAPVVQGLGEVSPNGVRSRGLVLASRRGQPVAAPAAGTIRFCGPFRDYDGIVIIDHGHGWMSLIINASCELPAGRKVAAGEPLGRAIGQLGVELSHNGHHWSPALIAGSSATLSNRSEDG